MVEGINMDDIQKLKEVLINGNPMLFLGAGFSYGSTNSYGDMATDRKSVV